MTDIILNATKRVITLDNGCETVQLTCGGSEVTISQAGTQGPQGPAGEGVPLGGEKHQFLIKASDADSDFKWAYSWRQLAIESEYVDTPTIVVSSAQAPLTHDGSVLTHDGSPITTTVTGEVDTLTIYGQTIYRFVHDSENDNGYSILDAFYSAFDGSTLSGLLAQRGK